MHPFGEMIFVDLNLMQAAAADYPCSSATGSSCHSFSPSTAPVKDLPLSVSLQMTAAAPGSPHAPRTCEADRTLLTSVAARRSALRIVPSDAQYCVGASGSDQD